jgi:hypothetical protein
MFLFVIIRIFFYIFVIGSWFLQHESNANVGLTNVQNGEYLPPFVFTCLFVLYILYIRILDNQCPATAAVTTAASRFDTPTLQHHNS